MKAIWSGAIGFGLVNIPVKLYSATVDTQIDFDMLSKKDLAPIRYARISTSSGKEVPFKDIVKGVEYSDGRYIVVTDDDFKRASPERSKTIEIHTFVDQEEIDPIYYSKPYFLMPAKGAEKSYQLLLKALDNLGKIAIAEMMIRNREHLCAIKSYGDLLLLNQMRYQSELRISMQPSPTAHKEKISAKEMELAKKLIGQLSDPFDPAAFKDTYISELKKIIKAKAAGKKIKPIATQAAPSKVTDLMDVLKQSLETTTGKKKKAG